MATLIWWWIYIYIFEWVYDETHKTQRVAQNLKGHFADKQDHVGKSNESASVSYSYFAEIPEVPKEESMIKLLADHMNIGDDN